MLFLKKFTLRWEACTYALVAQDRHGYLCVYGYVAAGVRLDVGDHFAEVVAELDDLLLGVLDVFLGEVNGSYLVFVKGDLRRCEALEQGLCILRRKRAVY